MKSFVIEILEDDISVLSATAEKMTRAVTSGNMPLDAEYLQLLEVLIRISKARRSDQDRMAPGYRCWGGSGLRCGAHRNPDAGDDS